MVISVQAQRDMLHFYDYFIFLPFDQPEEIHVRILCKILGSRFAIPATVSTDTYMCSSQQHIAVIAALHNILTG